MHFKNLQQEFLYYAAKAKYDVLLARMIAYFEAVEQDEVNLSGIYYKSPKQRAEQAIRELVLNDPRKFNSLYEKARLEV